MTLHETYMQRCLQLARLAMGYTAPNPMVGAVLVYGDTIIGEGYHQEYGKAHAEVNCLASVKDEHRPLIARSTLYVSLEPCSHWGKTPPCADLIIKEKIPYVVVGCRDPFPRVDGKGIEKLVAAGVDVTTGILEEACKDLNKRFFTVHQKKRPYILLKWAETLDGKIAPAPLPPRGGVSAAQPSLDNDSTSNISSLQNRPLPLGATPVPHPSASRRTPSPKEKESGNESNAEGLGKVDSLRNEGRPARLMISNEFSGRLVHKWRSEEAAILVGTNTALYDNPQLGTRLWPGKNPVRLVLDRNLRLPSSLQIFDGTIPTIIFNRHRHNLPAGKIDPADVTGVSYYQLAEENILPQLLTALYGMNIQSVLVEGGAQLLQAFINERLWDEARVITNEELVLNEGLFAPQLMHHQLVQSQTIFSDTIRYYQPLHNGS